MTEGFNIETYFSTEKTKQNNAVGVEVSDSGWDYGKGFLKNKDNKSVMLLYFI